MAPGYIIVWRPAASSGHHNCTKFNPSTVKVISWYFWLDAPVSRLMAGSKVNMLHLVSSAHPAPMSLILLLFHLLWVFYTSISWSSFTDVWVIAILFLSPECFGWSQQCSSLYGLDSFSDFQFLLSLFQAFGDHSKYTN